MTLRDSPPSHRPRRLQRPELEPLFEFLRIPSVSAIAAHADDVGQAAQWIASFVCSAGGQAEIVDWNGRPIVDALIPASAAAEGAPTMLCYGHFDTQPAEPLELWVSAPFEPTIRDGWLYARGVADDKGQLWALLTAAAELSTSGQLPVNIRFCCDGEEEVGGTSIVEYLRQTASDPIACVIFDSAMLDDETPVFLVGARGTIYLHVRVRTGTRDLHSGIYGGASLNALHVLVAALGRLFDEHGRPCAALRQDVIPPSEREKASWDALRDGNEVLASQGAALADARAGDEFYDRTWTMPSLDINGIEGGSPVHTKTIVVADAQANLSMRLAPGQLANRFVAILDELLTEDLPDGATMEVDVVFACDAASTASDSAPLKAAADAVERVMGRRPLLLRSGVSLPLFALLEELQIPTIITGFDVPDGNIHSPNERMRVVHLRTAVDVARQMFLALGAL